MNTEDKEVVDLSDFILMHADIESAIKLSRKFGNVAWICETINSDLPFSPDDRKLLADFIWREMKLVRPRGNTRIMRMMNPGRAALLNAAAHEFRNLRKAAKAAGQSRPARDDTLAAVAAKYSLSANKLDNRVRRSRRRPTRKMRT